VSGEINYQEEGVAPPSVDINDDWTPINVRTPWKQKGNYIFREGDELRYASKIPSNVILQGTDDNGNPILKKIEL
jgi:hypothetical protein